MVANVLIIPTGDELISGIIQDSDSPAIAARVREAWPECTVRIHAPMPDTAAPIRTALHTHASAVDLVILIGGSGGGRDFDPDLAVDCTHHGMLACLESVAKRELWGYNGHLWSRLLAGRCGGCIAFNVPGPFVEAVAAADAGIAYLATCESVDLDALVAATAHAVYTRYPRGRIRLQE